MEKRPSLLSQILKYLVLLAVSTAFMGVCSLSTTPLLRYSVGQDSAFFQLVGQGMTRGMLPYRDFFDMKGPYLFLLQYLGQCIAWGRLGAFVVQCGCFFVTLVFSVKILEQAAPLHQLKLVWSLLLLIPAALVMSYTMTGGNLTEELSLPVLMPCLYLCLRYLSRSQIPSLENQDHSLWAGFYYGIAFGCMCLIRITNAALIGAILLTVTVNLLVWRRWKNLFANALCFLVGVAVGVAPGIVWAAANGILPEMLDQVFLFGFRYSGELGFFEKLAHLGDFIWPCLFAPLLPLAVLAVYRVRDWKYWLLTVSSFLTLLTAVVLGNLYCHYFVLGIPNVVLASWLFVRFSGAGTAAPRTRRLRAALAVLLTVVSFAVQWPILRNRGLGEIYYGIHCMRSGEEDRREYDAVMDIVERIPEESRGSVYVYGLTSCSAWYLQAGLLPPQKYCDWQEHYIQLVPQIGRELTDWLAGGGARWVVIPAGQKPRPEQIAQTLQQFYVPEYENDRYTLLRAK